VPKRQRTAAVQDAGATALVGGRKCVQPRCPLSYLARNPYDANSTCGSWEAGGGSGGIAQLPPAAQETGDDRAEREPCAPVTIMASDHSPSGAERDRKAAALERTIRESERQLQELRGTGGNADEPTYALHETHERLRHSQAAQRHLAETQVAILNALPAHVALLDSHGVIVSVNDSWRRFGLANAIQGTTFGVGQNYLELCERETGESADDARRAATGIRAVLGGQMKEFALEYPCHSPDARRWFRLMVTPLHEGQPGGAVVMHVNITEQKLAELERQKLVHDLGERVKEMRALYGVARLLRHDQMSIGEILARVAAVLPLSVQYPDVSAARVAFGARGAATPGFKASPWQLGAEFVAGDGTRGTVEIVYLEARPEADEGPFLSEERNLVDSVAELLRTHFEWRRDRDALLASEANLRNAQRIAQFGSWELELANLDDLDANTLRWSDEMYRIAGFAPGAVEVSNELFFRLVPAEEHAIIRDAVARALRERRPYSVVHRLIRPDGEERIVQETAQVFCDETTGQPEKLIGAALDTTEQRRAERQVSAFATLGRRLGGAGTAEEAARIIMETADDLLGWDACWLHVYDAAADRARSVLNMDVVEGRRQVIGPAYHEGAPSALSRRVLRDGPQLMVREPAAPNQEELIPFGDTSRRSASLMIVPVRHAGEPIALLSIQSYAPHAYRSDDLTSLEALADYCAGALARIGALEAMRRSEARFASIFRASPAAISLSTIPDGRLIEVNDRYCELLGYRREELIGQSVLDLHLWENAADRRPIIERVLSEGSAFGVEARFRRKCGELRDVVLSFEKTDLPGEPEPVVIVQFADVTEKKRLEAQFLRAQRMESIGTLAGGIAHDLNNVLAPILMSIDMLRELVPDPDGQMLLDTLQHSAQRGADLVKQVLGFARGVEGRRAVVNPIHLLRDLVRVMRDTFPKSIAVNLATGTDVWTVLGDATQLHQVFLNLCLNARDVMPGGGQIIIDLENVVLDETYAAMNPDSRAGAYVVVQVADTGAGIPPELRDKIFEPFFTTKEFGKGTGLGLSTALAIVKSHGGFINLYSELGKGTRFKVYLPANTTERAADEFAVKQTGLPRGHGELVLVVDDEDAVRKVAQRTLERFGYRVLLAANGAEGVSLYALHQHDIAVVLTDMAMPIMDGPSLILALKAMNPAVKIVGSSGLMANGGVAKAIGAGVEHFIPKPYTAEAMLKTIHNVIHGIPPHAT